MPRRFDGDHIREVAVFKCDQARHDFGQTRGIDALVSVLLVNSPSGIEVNKKRRLGRNREIGVGGDDGLLRGGIFLRFLRGLLCGGRVLRNGGRVL